MTFGGSLALDIALRGNAGSHKDVDNVAHDVIAGFMRALEHHSPELAGYRVYRQPATEPAVRARAMPAIRLERLLAAMKDARHELHTTRSDRRKAAGAAAAR